MCDSSQILGATFIGFAMGWGANMLVQFFRRDIQFQRGVEHGQLLKAIKFLEEIDDVKMKAQLETEDISEFRGKPITHEMKLAIKWASAWYLDKLRSDTKKAHKVFFK